MLYVYFEILKLKKNIMNKYLEKWMNICIYWYNLNVNCMFWSKKRKESIIIIINMM